MRTTNDYNMGEKLRKAYNKISSDYLQKKEYPWRDFIQFVKMLDLQERDTIIDIGAGNGRNLHALPAGLYIALDLSYELLRGYVGPEQGQRIAGALPCLPFRSKSTDTVFSIAVLHHFSDQEKVILSLQEITRLGDGAVYLFSVWRRWRKGHREKIISALKDDTEIDPLINHERPWYDSDRNIMTTRFYHYYTFRELHDQLRKVNLQIDVVNYLGGRHDDANIFVKVTQQS